MKKKVFSLMMMLLLTVTGFVRASEVTVHDGTITNSYIPVWGLWTDNSLQHEFVYPAAELSDLNGGQITALKFYSTSSYANVSWNGTFRVYLKEVSSATISSFLGTSDATLVYEGTLSVATQEMSVNFTTPYAYNGGNLWIAVYYTATTGYSSCYWYGETVTGAAIYGRSGASYSVNTANFLPKTTFTYTAGGNGGGFEDNLHVKYMDGEEEVIDSLNMGVRPAGAWMEPFQFTMYSEGPTYTVTVLDFTPSDGMFSVSGEELPFQVAQNADVELTLACNGTEAGIIERQFVAITEGNRAAHIWPVVVELYTPECPDVVEVAYELNDGEALEPGFSYEGIPSQITPTTLHNDYTLPFPEIEEGLDAVYKFTVEGDVIINAYVDSTAANGKVALYTEDFYGEGGPMATNNYTGLTAAGGGAAGAPFEAQIGEGTTTSTYFPFHTLWNYSIGENLFLASELTEAGVTTAPMSSLSWYVSSMSCSTPQNNISIWMANVSEEALTSTSYTTDNMTLVYTGNGVLPTAGQWNEFVFNEGSFAWDGHSNLLILCTRNNGTYQGSISWQTHNPGFVAMAYAYSDTNGGYYVATAPQTGLNTSSTNRANIILKSNGRTDTPDPNVAPIAPSAGEEEWTVSAGPVIENLPLTAGTYYLVASSTDEDYTVFINIDEMPCPMIEAEGFAFGPTPADDEDEVEPASVTLRWNVPEYATGWRLVFGSTYYPEPGHPQTILYPEDGSFSTTMANSYTVTNLWNNTNYFWHVEFNNGSCEEGVSSPIWGFTTHLNIPQNLTAVDYTVFDD